MLHIAHASCAICLQGKHAPQPTPALRACTPARAGYGADLQDASLKAAGAEGKLLKERLTFTFKDFGCLVNDANFTFPDPAPFEASLGSVVEWAADHIHAHPL